MRSDVDSKRVVDLGAVTEILDNHLTRDLVQAVFEKERVGERERSLTLHLMLQFWTAVVLRAPASLSQALRKATVGGDSIFPYVGVSKQAFFQRCANLNWEFFAEVFRTFVQGLASTEPPRFARQHAEVAERFRGIWVLDGSHLDPVARRLKILWEDGRRALPGTILGCYDLMRGTLADLLYAPTPRTSELTLARQALDGLEAGLLLVADRLYGTARFLSDVQKMGHWGVFRNQGWAHTTEVTCRSRTSYDGGNSRTGTSCWARRPSVQRGSCVYGEATRPSSSSPMCWTANGYPHVRSWICIGTAGRWSGCSTTSRRS